MIVVKLELAEMEKVPGEASWLIGMIWGFWLLSWPMKTALPLRAARSRFGSTVIVLESGFVPVGPPPEKGPWMKLEYDAPQVQVCGRDGGRGIITPAVMVIWNEPPLAPQWNGPGVLMPRLEQSWTWP